MSEDDRSRRSQNGYPRSSILSAGDVLGDRFVIVDFLARGGMGEVYEAQDRVLQGTLVALKTISSSQSGDLAAQERFKKEVLLARQISHPNVCPIYDLFYCNDSSRCQCFLTMKLLRGESLATRLERVGRLHDDEAWPVVQQIASALRAAHEAGVIHRDFKPGNIMLEGSGPAVKATVTDFGLARDLHSNSTLLTQGQVCGTPGYIAPELFQGRTASPATDLYAFGVVLQEIYTGRRPDLSVTQPISSPPSPGETAIKEVPRVCARLIRDCLDPDPLIRCRAFDRALPVLDRKSSSGFTYAANSRQSRRKFLVGTAAGVTGLAAGVWWKSDAIQDLFEPLPAKRFVALLSWPKPSDARLAPLLAGALDAIEAELSRAEVDDRDLLIISPRDVKISGGDVSQLKQCCDSVGANLALAASGDFSASRFKLSLKLLEAATNTVLRERHVVVAEEEVTAFASLAVAAAASLLNLNAHQQKKRTSGGTDSAEAYRLFETGHADFAKVNDTGLDSAIDNFIKAVAADPRYVDAYGELAFAYFRKFAITNDSSFLELARSNASAALRLDPRAVNAYLASAEILAASGEPTKAIQEITKALAIDPENFRTLNIEAAVYRRLGRLADAEATYQRLLSIRPNHWLTYNELGWLLNSEGRYREALKNFRMSVTLTPRSYLALNNVGALCLKFGQIKDAEVYFERSLSAQANDLAYSNLSEIALANGKSGEALRYALKAVELSPAEDADWLQLGDCYRQIAGKMALARQAYSKAQDAANHRLQTDNTDGPAWMLLALYTLKLDSHFDPMPLVRKAELFGANDLDSRFTKIRILELAGKRDEAMALTRECFKRGLTPTEVFLVPDLASLRRDARYSVLEKTASKATKA